MERMEGVDAGYLYMETPSMHMHTLKIALLDPRRPVALEEFTEALMSRLHQLPPMRRRVVPVPFHLNHPLWAVDDEIDPRHHVFAHRLGPGATMADLEDRIGEIASTPLDRARPLWEVHLIEGLPGGRLGAVAKIHHSLADGGAANAMLANIADQFGAALSESPGAPDVLPSRARQVQMALADAIAQIWTLPAILRRTLLGLVGMVRHKRRSRVSTPRPLLDTPRTPFNGALTPRRSFTTVSLPLADVKRARELHGVTVNDVVLAVVAGSLRSFLTDHGGRPVAPLVAGVPVGTDTTGGPVRLHGNRVSNLFTTLATDIEDPVERLHEIARITRETKHVQQALGPDLLREWVQFTPPAPFSLLLRLYSRWRAAGRHAPPFNVIVSNVRGPAEPATIAGAELSDLFSVGPLIEGIGLNITAWSYVDRLNFSLLSCPDLVPDIRPLAARFPAALEDLLRDAPVPAGAGR